MKQRIKGVWAITILVVMSLVLQIQVKAADKGDVFSLEQAQELACLHSIDCRILEEKLKLKQAEYEESLKAVKLKQINRDMFRWNPLMDFQFPQELSQKESFEQQYEPVQIRAEITALRHELWDTRYQVIEEISNLYIKVYTLQEKTALWETQRVGLGRSLESQNILVKTGEASPLDLDMTRQALEKKNSELSLSKREEAHTREKIMKLTTVDVTTDVPFEDPTLTFSIERGALSELIEHTLEMDQTYYEARLNTRQGQVSLEMNGRILNGHYGDATRLLSPYVDQAKAGEEVDSEAFKRAYDLFLREIERPWDGTVTVPFMTIPKEWLKGSEDGIRYIEDNPYAMYTEILKYSELKQEEKKIKEEVITKVSDSFESLVTAKNAYESLRPVGLRMKTSIHKKEILNRLGQLSKEELKEEQDSFEEAKMDELEMLSSYSQLLYSFERMTCGGVSAYLRKIESLVLLDRTKEGKIQNINLNGKTGDGARYYLDMEVEKNVFIIKLYIPPEQTIQASDFELWVDDVQIGERTPIEEELKHLTLTVGAIEKAEIKLYLEDEYVGMAEIDPLSQSGELVVFKEETEE